ncbi:hypothetical protein [Bacillus sp. UMB0728]|uniref:hypothetical protein n=1 Tax=Bacillus sp. UMB0728 TaxID=2066052 RepID=UPI000C78DDD0|nr:hypothetical protein [Bacillus sp. UMB0728]PLR72298.1 hypothetical protein CYJ37_12130 [Bacillus sp. UMB0728]
MRKLFLDDIPKRGNKYNWKKSIGHKIRFVYDEIQGTLEIVSYDGRKLNIKFKGKEKKILTDMLVKCQIGTFVGARSSRQEEFKYKVGNIVETRTGNILIRKCFRSGNTNSKTYEYECLNCGNNDNIFEGNLNKMQGCNVCCNPSKKILIGYNDLWTTHPNTASLLKYKEMGYELSHGSHKRQDFICPNCSNEVKNKQIPNIIIYGLSCPKCSDGVSYPEKFMYNVLNQLNIEFEQQKIFSWFVGKRYDFYIPSLKCIIEIHGEQHYGKGFSKLNGLTLEEVKENDRQKESVAKSNGIEYYISVDCSRSEFKFVQNSIFNRLNDTLKLEKVNWLECHKYACGTLIKSASDLWNSGKKVLDIKEIMKVNSGTTIIKYLKQANELGWCNYDPSKIMKEIGKIPKDTTPRPVVRLSLNGEFIDEFNSRGQASKILSIYKSGIQQVCEGKREQVKGFKFKYKEDYEMCLIK